MKKIFITLLSLLLFIPATSIYAAEDDPSTPPSSMPDKPNDMTNGEGKEPPAGENYQQDEPQGKPQNFSQKPKSYTAANTYDSDISESNQSYQSNNDDENAILVTGGKAIFLNPTITRNTTSSGGDNASFYGIGAAFLTTNGSAYIEDGNITTVGNGATGVFSYGDGTIYISDTTIKTSGDTAGGIHVAGGGTLYAYDLDVETNGNSSAAIRSDRGGGTMVIDGGEYISNGTGSPAIYVTADISVNDAELIANNSEAICIEGLNTLRLYNSKLISNMQDDAQNDSTWSIILYQSMSGDSEVGTSSFYMSDGSIESNNGGLFYITNTSANIYLNGVDIKTVSDSPYFLRVSGNNNQRGWGTSGANGADLNFTADDQEINGDIIYDSISNLDFYLTNNSTLNGAFIDDETYAPNKGNGKANLYIDSSSTWIVDQDSTLSNLYCAGKIVDSRGNSVSVIGEDGTVYIKGSSEYTVTVSTYSDKVDLSNVLVMDEFSNYAVAKPSELKSGETKATATPKTSENTNATDIENNTSKIAWYLTAIIGIVIIVLAFLPKKKKE